VSNLQYISKKSTVKLVQLFDAYDVRKDGSLLMQAPNGQPYDFVVAGDPRTYNDLATNEGLNFIKTYANGIGPWKPYIQPYTFTDANNDGTADDINNDGIVDDRDYTKLPATDLIKRAHERGLVVHAYTFRNEPRRLLKDYNNDPTAEYKNFYDLGIDGVFSDFPATAVAARKK
jgi:glycerophosphoryl diester phosphodiesterase